MELIENKDLLQTVFDSASNGIAVMQSLYNEKGEVDDFSILLFNAYTLKWIGDIDYKGKRYSDVFPMVKETGILEKFIEVAETGVTANFESWYVGEGMKNWFRFTAVKQAELLVVTTEDITEQKQAEEVIRQKEERFRFALKVGYLGFWELDLTTFALDASDHCKKNFGQHIDVPFTYEDLKKTIHPDDRQCQEEEVTAAILTNKDYDIEYRVIWPDGTLHWVNVRGQLHTDNEGKPNYMIGVSVDITERKQTEITLIKALEATEKQKRLYDSITNNTPDLVYVFDPAYYFTYANKALLTMWGKTAEDAIGKGLRDNGYEEWHALMHEKEIDEVVANKKTIRGTVSFPHAELGSRIYDYIFTPVLNEKGDVEAIAGTTRDITDLKRVEESLQQSEARFRSLLQEAPVAATLFRGPELIIEIANELTQKYWRKSKEIIGKPVGEAAPELEDQQMIALLSDMYQRGGTAYFSETPITFIENGVSKEGYYTHSLKALYDSNGNVESILGIGIDVTEQVKIRKRIEESEARLKSMIDQTPAPTLVLMGDDLVIEEINYPMLQMIGRGEEIIGNPLITIMPELEGQYVWEKVKKVYREGTIFDQWEVLVPHNRTGVMQDYYYNIAYRPLKEEGQITGMIQVAIDVTEQVVARKKLEESESLYRTLSGTLEQQVNERTKELKRSNEDLQQFAHVASHDLKEPVRKIKIFVSRLEEQLAGKMDESARRFIERIHVATDRMFTMIDGVLVYSTLNAGKQKPELINLNEVIKNIETDLELALQKRAGKIQCDELPTIEGAPVLLYQLFYNLINNSIKFAKTDLPSQITITSEIAFEQHRKFANITLQDNGIGFEPDQAALIFETFIRLNSKDNYEGTGLGLSLCKKIVERHSGKILAKGMPNKGAIFIIKLPLQQNEKNI